MYVSIKQKLLVSIVGLAFSVGILLLFTWWLAILAFMVMIPFFYKVLTA